MSRSKTLEVPIGIADGLHTLASRTEAAHLHQALEAMLLKIIISVAQALLPDAAVVGAAVNETPVASVNPDMGNAPAAVGPVVAKKQKITGQEF